MNTDKMRRTKVTTLPQADGLNRRERITIEKPRGTFISKINAFTPLINLAAAMFCVTLTLSNIHLWDNQGFLMVVGLLLGNAGTGAFTQHDE